MKIQVLGDITLVSSVCVEQTAQGFLHLLVNTRERGAPYQVSGGWGLYLQSVPGDEVPPKHRVLEVGQVDDYSIGAEVVLIAESDAEGELVQGIAYEAQCKDQIEILIVPMRANLAPKELARWKST